MKKRDVVQHTLYCHTNRVNGKRYVGQSVRTMQGRWKVHVYRASHYLPEEGCRAFYNALRKYGPDAFTHEVLAVVSTQAEANAAERAWIAQFKSRAPYGYNLDEGGGVGPKHPDTRRLIGEAQRRAAALKTPEQRSAVGVKTYASAKAASVGIAGATPEQLGDWGKRLWATMTPEERSAELRRRWATVPVALRKERALARAAKMSPEKHSERTRKGWASAERRVEYAEASRARMTPEHARAMVEKTSHVMRKRARDRKIAQEATGGSYEQGERDAMGLTKDVTVSDVMNGNGVPAPRGVS